MKVFVTDGISPATPAIMESLSRYGLEVHVGESFKANAAFFSRYSHAKMIYPEPAQNPLDFSKVLLDYLCRNKIKYLIPVRSCSIEAVLIAETEFREAGIKTLLPESLVWNTGEHKHQTLKIAEQLQVPMPRTVFDRELGYRQLAQILGEPFLIKLSRSSGARGIFKIADERQFAKARNHLHRLGESCYFYQEIIPPGGMSCNASYLFDRGSGLLAWFMMAKIRQYPLWGGSTSYARPRYDAETLENGRRLLEAMKWVGVAEVEFIQDPRDGVLKLLEVNPRFWNPLLLAIRAGVDFPRLLIKAMDGQIMPQVQDFKQDVGFSFFPYELINLFKGRNFAVLKDLLSRRNTHDNYFKLGDPGLFLGMMVQTMHLKLSKSSLLQRNEFQQTAL